MYLSRLELHGFKSFALPTNLTFDPGVTAVVGPNGCGKSNIVDAVRWVIGEQRARILRSDKMESVIFNGTSKRRPLGMAEVMLTIENTEGVLPVEYTEVTVGRRLYRSGESEYLLNGSTCRLKDITDLFMDTGMGAGAYSVIELKMIEEILSDNTHDRRRLFEEAAGITKYKLRRTQTLRKLASTQADLTRVQDLVEEIEKRVRSLERQARKAARYKEISGRLRTLELALAKLEFTRLESEREVLEKEIRQFRDRVEGDTAKHGKSESDLMALKKRLLDNEAVLAEEQQKLNQYLEDLRALEAEFRVNVERKEAANSSINRALLEKADTHERLDFQRSDLDRINSELEETKPILVEAERILIESEKVRDQAQEYAAATRHAVNDARIKEQHAIDELNAAVRELDRLTSRYELFHHEQTQGRERLDAIAGHLQTVIETENGARNDAEQTRAEWESAKRTLESAEAALHNLRTDKDSALAHLRKEERIHDSLAAEIQLLNSLVSSHDDLSGAIQTLADNPGWQDDDLLTVGDIFQCDKKYRPALDAAIRPYRDVVVVRSVDEADSAFRLLQDQNAGQVTCLVLDRLPASRETQRPTNSLAQHVSVRDVRYDKLTSIILSDVVLVESFDEAKRIGVAGQTVAVTLNGELAGPDGSVRSGSVSGESVVSGHVGRLEQLKDARQALAEHSSALQNARSRYESIEADLSAIALPSLKAAFDGKEQLYRKAERVSSEITFERDSLSKRAAETENRLRDIERNISEIETARASTEKVFSAAEKEVAILKEARRESEEVFHTAETESRVAISKFSEANIAKLQAENRVANLLRDEARAKATITELSDRIGRLEKEELHLKEQIQKTEALLEQLERDIQTKKGERPTYDAGVQNARSVLMSLRTEISEKENTLRDIRRQKEEQLRLENERAIRLAEVQTRSEDLVTHLLEDYGIDAAEIEAELEEGMDEKQGRGVVKDLRNSVRSMGPVNALALEEFEEEKERLDFMSEQFEDLKQAEKTLLETIDEINTTASKRFNDTFVDIRTNFQKLFEELFGKEAKADVLLEEPDDPLESPIEVMAKPRGKRPSVLAQLSGGEKTLTAIALLFAIYLVKPSPFCILDEVDAPLDDANVGRFMNLIREFSKSTQFILVTHNKRTMEAADRMYGVTMQEQGVSNLVGVKFEEAAEMVSA